MKINGKWWWFFDGEAFDVGSTRWSELTNGVTTNEAGGRGAFTVTGGTLKKHSPAWDGLALREAGPSTAAPIWLSGCAPAGTGIVRLARDGSWAAKLASRNRRANGGDKSRSTVVAHRAVAEVA